MKVGRCVSGSLNRILRLHLSFRTYIGHVESVMRSVFEIAEDKETRIWNKYMSNTYELLNKKEQTVQDCGLYNGQVSIHIKCAYTDQECCIFFYIEYIPKGIYYMHKGILLATKTLVESICHYIRDPSGVCSVCYAREWHIDKFPPFYCCCFENDRGVQGVWS